MNLTTFTHKVRRHAEDHSWRVAAGKVLKALAAPVYAHTIYRIYKINVSHMAGQDVQPPDGFEFQVLDTSSTDDMAKVEAYAEWLDGRLCQMIDDGAVCLVAKHDGEQAGFNLVSFGSVKIPLLKFQRTFAPGDAWSDHIMVGKEFRGRGLASCIRRRMFAELAARGVKRLYGGAETWNTPSLKLARRLGFTEIADVHLHRILGIKSWSVQRVR